MKRFFLTILIFCLTLNLLQAQSLTLTFTGHDINNDNVQLTRVEVYDGNKGWWETLTWPDTVLYLSATGIDDFGTLQGASIRLSQNSPNPFEGTTFVNLQVSESGDVSIAMTDITGRVVGTNHYLVSEPGTYSLRVTIPSAGLYFLTASQKEQSASVKMVNLGSGSDYAITFMGATEETPLQTKSHSRGVSDNPFDLGDMLDIVGYTIFRGEEVKSNRLWQGQYESQTIDLSFTMSLKDGQPCLGTPTLTDVEGNVYNTVQIGLQCWMKENLRVSKYADGTDIPYGGNDYSYFDPYYYDYDSSGIPLEERGYLYNWPAAMHGASSSTSNPSGVQGVCPSGWHLPSSAEWSQLTMYVKDQTAYTCGPDINYFIGKAMASTSWWDSSTKNCAIGNDLTANNITGFSVVPAGYYGATLVNAGAEASIWSSTEQFNEASTYFKLLANSQLDFHYNSSNSSGFSVRCVRD
ncbi:MAG: T9SS type A sorting domain-containing protein [Bacteroidales bacterium]|nr:T9SS type A sorting domain-containing protein [Bacteroidales bacterium]